MNPCNRLKYQIPILKIKTLGYINAYAAFQ